MEGFQHQKLLPVCLQRCTDCYQEEEVSGNGVPTIWIQWEILKWSIKMTVRISLRVSLCID